jgi:hypothetical protein
MLCCAGIAQGNLVRLYCPVRAPRRATAPPARAPRPHRLRASQTGQYNEFASLTFCSGHHTIARLFSRNGQHAFGVGAVFALLITYLPLACVTAGSAVSSGLVVPALLVGACVGRLVGLLGLLLVPSGSYELCDAPLGKRPPQCFYQWVPAARDSSSHVSCDPSPPPSKPARTRPG